MNIDNAIQEASVLQHRLRAGKLLSRDGADALKDLTLRLRAMKANNVQDWQVAIPREMPISFRDTDPQNVKYRMHVDLHGQLSMPDAESGFPTGSHCLVIRVWCLDRQQWFDHKLDCANMPDEIKRNHPQGERRVMLRFRFDYDDHSGDEEHQARHPRFHLQVGGQMADDEYCRIPQNLAVPRFNHHPMGLTMATEFIVKNFFPEDRAIFDEEASLRGILRMCQRSYLNGYLDACSNYGSQCDTSYQNHLSRLPRE